MIYLARPGEAELGNAPGTVVVPAGLGETHRYGAGLVFLKGRMFDLFAAGLAQEGEGVWGDLLVDGTPGTFLRMAEKGLAILG